MKLSAEKYKIIMGGMLILLIYFLFNTIIPQIYYMFNSISKYYTTISKLEEASNWENESLVLKRRINKLYVDINNINLKMPKKGQVSKPVGLIDSLAGKNRLKITEFKKTGEETTKQYDIIKARLVMEGEYFDNKNFVKQLENAKILIKITGMDLKLHSFFKKKLIMEINISVLFKR